MHIWIDLILRELALVALLAALGAGPATFLPPRYAGAARFALAPVLGLAIGACVSVTLVYFFPARYTGWVLPLLAVASLAVVWRRRYLPHWPGARTAVPIAVVALLVLLSFDYPLALRHTVGPDGGYNIADTAGYVAETDGAWRQSIQQAQRDRPPFADLSLIYWSGYAQSYQQVDITPLEANVNELLGLKATDTQSAFLIAVLLIGALGVFGVVRAVAGAPPWAAVVGSYLFAGPLFVELFMDGSQAAIAGCALLAPAVALGCDALRYRTAATLVLFAVMVAGVQTVYPLFVPCVVIGGAVAIGVLVIRRLRRGPPTLDEVLLAIGQLAGVIALAALFTPVQFERNVRYWTSLLNGSLSLVGLPTYVLPVNILPGWMLQTREFYGLVDLSNATAGQLLLGALVPLLMLAVIAFAVRRHRDALMMLVVAGGAAALAYYAWSGRNCSYCVQRNLIPAAALAAPAIGIGVAALATLRSRARIALAAAAAAVVVVAVGHEGVVERQRLANTSYLLDNQDRQALSALPAHAGPLELEGFGQGPAPPMELPMAYNLANEKNSWNVSLPTDRDDNHGLTYMGGIQPLGPAFNPYYRYVLTRLGSISTDRRVVARSGPIALEQRTHTLDVTITGGVTVAMAWVDTTGGAWVNPGLPLHFIVSGGTGNSRAWISLVLKATVPVKVQRQPGLSTTRRGSTVRICLPAGGTAPIREAGVQVSFIPQAPPPPPEPYADALPPRGVRLTGMTVSTTPC